jgi:multidrug efflux pump subunit AcrB
MWLTKLVLRRPVSVLVVVLGLLIFGVVSVFSLPLELTPELEMPMLVISTIYPGAAPQDVEKLVTHEIEGVAASLSGIKSIASNSNENSSLVMLTYEYGTNMDIAYTDLTERLGTITNSLPAETMSPLIIEIDLNNMTPNVTLSVSSETVDNLRNYVEEEIVPELEKLSSVADVSISGGREQYIRVELREEKLSQYGVGMAAVIGALSAADFSLPAGNADYGDRSLAVRGQSEVHTVAELRLLPISLPGGAVIRLEDVATVYEALRDADSLSR